MSNQIENLVRVLGVSVDEAKEIVEADHRIDKGENPFPLSPEQEKASKKARSVAKSPTAYNFTKRERKADEDKRFLIDSIVWLLTEEESCGDHIHATEIDVINPEREVEFVYNNRKFKIVLSCPRS